MIQRTKAAKIITCPPYSNQRLAFGRDLNAFCSSPRFAAA